MKKTTKVGVVDERNKLNELTGKEWLKFQKSWFVFDAIPSDLAEERKTTVKTRDHPATFSPTMVGEFIEFFTKPGMNVLDPFVGIGTTLVACERCGRLGYGVELNKEYAEIARKRVSGSQKVITGDARNIADMGLPEIDFCITSPPYTDMLHKEDVNQKKRKEMGLATRYGDDDRDLGNVHSYDEFLTEICGIFDEIYDILRPGAHLVVIVQNVVNGSAMLPLAWDIAIKLSRPPFRYELKKEKIWCQDRKKLHPFGYPYAWVSNTMHHYCLVFMRN
jgi:DNA modification methylase